MSIQDVTPELAKQFKASTPEGALVGEVVPNSAAAEAGLKSGDIITEFNHKPIQNSRDLQLMVAGLAPGTTTEVKALRDGTEKTFNVTLKESRAEGKRAISGQPAAENDDPLQGVSIADIDHAARAELNIPANVKGVVVSQVDPNAPAFAAGLRPGDVIQEIDRQPISTTDEAMKADKQARAKSMLVLFWRQGRSGYLVLKASQG